ncbi:hypothetical protein SK803_19605 [Lentzea sp. BCCO 10_0856]|uniref:DUF3558 domain-containing protein n=1 Tax=Lentzea miocenica TaxID=3095431 RepID=A0ABU4T362_9PSEU|nr:hypothetical protein [Lentzea sp. BCCO 10_0856]MDX8032427.1 hypothetical protein [Lentzea sp. BCCO 10_0856]
MRPRRIIGVTITTMALAGGCTATPVPTVTFSTAPVSTTTPAPGPVKYASASFRSCPEIQQKVPGLPPALKAEPTLGSGEFGLTCTFTASKNDGTPMITLDVILYENQQNSSGAERAKLAFTNGAQAGGVKDTGVHPGSEARWPDAGVAASCRLEFLDENAVMVTWYNSGKKQDPRSEECRRGARDVAKQLFDAVQP